MQLSRLVLGVFLALTENILDVTSQSVTQEFLNENGIIATIDGYLPRCSGCIVLGKTDILVYGNMHVPKEKFHLINRKDNGKFLVEFCGSYTGGPCDTLTRWDTTMCRYKYSFLIGCNASDENYFKKCSCDDTHPKRWSVLMSGRFLNNPNGVFRIVFIKSILFKRPFTPMFPNNTLYVSDLIQNGHAVANQGSFKLSRSNTEPSCPPPDLKSTVIAMVLTIFGLIMA